MSTRLRGCRSTPSSTRRSALLWLAGVLVVSAVHALIFDGFGALTYSASVATDAAATMPTSAPCPTIAVIGKGLDLGVPFLPTSRGAGSCQTTAAGAGVVLTISTWILQLVAWALAALFIAGFTGIVPQDLNVRAEPYGVGSAAQPVN